MLKDIPKSVVGSPAVRNHCKRLCLFFFSFLFAQCRRQKSEFLVSDVEKGLLFVSLAHLV